MKRLLAALLVLLLVLFVFSPRFVKDSQARWPLPKPSWIHLVPGSMQRSGLCAVHAVMLTGPLPGFLLLQCKFLTVS